MAAKERFAMRIDELLGGDKPTLSFEFFPPKTDRGTESLLQTIQEMKPLQPSFVSMTYGAGGSTRSQTLELVGQLLNEQGLRAMAHLTCVGHHADEIGAILDDLWAKGIRNLMALRGDPPVGQSQFVVTEGGFAHADELVAYAAQRHDFCIGVAGYPEGHPQCLNRTRDLENLKKKVDAGADFVVTQLFLDHADFYRFREEARGMGIKVPIVAGIMPITNVNQIKRFVNMCGAKIPHRFLRKLEAVENDSQAVYRLGVEYMTNLCRDLLFNDCQGLHFYSLNKSQPSIEIYRNLGFEHMR